METPIKERQMVIRKAQQEDCKEIAECLLLAMEEIVYEFIGEKSHTKAYDFMLYFTSRENNQYSYENCWVLESQNKVIGAINVYDGGGLNELRKPISDYIVNQYHLPFEPEDETQEGEFYIDTFGVLNAYQGKGLGRELLQFVVEEFVTKKKSVLGLLVDKDNPSAKKLYERLGFVKVNEQFLVGKEMEHLQIR